MLSRLGPILQLAILIALPELLFAQTNEHTAPLKYENPTRLKGTIYPKGSDRSKPLFYFTRQATRSGDRLEVKREFTYPDGRVAARERALYQGDQLISWQLQELQIGAGGSATIQAGASGPKLQFDYSSDSGRKGASKRRTEEVPKNLLVSDMVGPFLQEHWEALMKGEAVKCRYIVLPRLETVGFTFEREREEKRNGKPLVIVKMSPTSFIISTLVDPLYFTIEKDGLHRVLEYQGRTTPKIAAGNSWKDLDAVTVFDW